MQKIKRVVGISLGTRQLGIAFFRQGRLSDWHIYSFKYAWSAFKKKQILRCVETIVKREQATMVALKISETEKQNQSFREILTDIEQLLFLHHIPCYSFTLPQLKSQLPIEYQKNKAAFMEGMMTLYPELHIEFQKERTNHNSYYIKIFEAIAAARLSLTTK